MFLNIILIEAAHGLVYGLLDAIFRGVGPTVLAIKFKLLSCALELCVIMEYLFISSCTYEKD